MSWRSNPNPCVKPPFGSYIDPGHPLAEGLVGCWIFNEDSGLWVNDLSPCKNSGIIHGASWGDGLSFDGSDDYVGCGNAASLNITDVLTLEAQVNMNDVTRSWQRILWKGCSTDDYPVQYSLLFHEDEIQFRIFKAGDPYSDWEYVETVNANLVAGKQYNLKTTYNVGDTKIYVDGIQKGSDTISSSLTGSSDNVFIAAPAYFSSIAGNVSGSNIRKKALSLDEVEWLNAEPYCFIAWPSHRVIFDYGAEATYTLSANAGAYALSGTAADVLANRLLSAEAGALTLTGQETNLLLGRLLSAEIGTFTLSGQDVNLLLNRLLATETGSFSLTGQSADLLLNRILIAESGSFSLTGTSINLLLGRILGAEAGSFTLTGTDVDLIYSGAGGPTYTLTADPGAFALTGTNASLLVNRILTADNGSFTLSGQDATLLLNRLLAAGTGSFTLSGQDVSLLAHRILNVETGDFTLTGQDAGLFLNRLLNAETGSFTLTGQDITLFANRKLDAENGLLNLIGQDVTLTWSGETLAVGKLTITFTPRKPGITFTPRKPGIILS